MAASLTLGTFGLGAGTAWAAGNGNAGTNAGGNGKAVAGANSHAGGNGTAVAGANSSAGGSGSGSGNAVAGANSHAGGNSANKTSSNSNAGGNKSGTNAGGNGNGKGNGGGNGNAGAAPPGNNGTIKIDGVPVDMVDNNPHVSCPFYISFYGYDTGTQRANITITAVAPTRGGTPYTATTGWTTAQRTSGSQFDATYQVDGTALMNDLSGVTPQAQQGYHLRVEVEVTGSQGSDDKYKVLWMQPCTPTVAGTTPPPGGGTPPPGGGVTTSPGSGSTNVVAPTVAAGHSPAVVVPAHAVTAPAASAAPAAVAAGHSANVPTSGGARTIGGLAFTGASVGGLVALGFGLIAGGLLLLRRSRRSATSTI